MFTSTMIPTSLQQLGEKMIRISQPVIDDRIAERIADVIRTGNLAQGKYVQEFEQKFAEYVGVKHAIAVSNGTSALHLALLVNGVGPDDEVITPSFTFSSAVNCILFCGAKPVFVDIGDDFNIDAGKVAEKITGRTKAMIVTHLFGYPADMDKLSRIANDAGIVLIEDCSQAVGSEFRGKKIGSFGTGCFSLYATKIITTGEGGMITTNDDKIAEKLRMLRHHGSSKQYYQEELGYNYRMTEIQGIIGIEQIEKIEELIEKRRECAGFYKSRLSGVESLVIPNPEPDRKHVFYSYPLLIRRGSGLDRDAIVQELRNCGIEAQIYYPRPVHKQSYYERLGYGSLMLPKTEDVSKRIFNIPIHPLLKQEELEFIVRSIKGLCEND